MKSGLVCPLGTFQILKRNSSSPSGPGPAKQHPTPTMFTCTVCKRTFSTQSGLTRHFQRQCQQVTHARRRKRRREFEAKFAKHSEDGGSPAPGIWEDVYEHTLASHRKHPRGDAGAAQAPVQEEADSENYETEESESDGADEFGADATETLPAGLAASGGDAQAGEAAGEAGEPAALPADTHSATEVLRARVGLLSEELETLRKRNSELEAILTTDASAASVFKVQHDLWSKCMADTASCSTCQAKVRARKPMQPQRKMKRLVETLKGLPGICMPGVVHAKMPAGVCDRRGVPRATWPIHGVKLKDWLVHSLARIPVECLPARRATRGVPDPMHTSGIDTPMGTALASKLEAAFADCDAVARAAFQRHRPGLSDDETPALAAPFTKHGRFQAHTMAGAQEPQDGTVSCFAESPCAHAASQTALQHRALPFVINVFMDEAHPFRQPKTAITPLSVRPMQVSAREARSLGSAAVLAFMPLKDMDFKGTAEEAKRAKYKAHQAQLRAVLLEPLAEIHAQGGLWIPVAADQVGALRDLGVDVLEPGAGVDGPSFVARVWPLIGAICADTAERWMLLNAVHGRPPRCSCALAWRSKGQQELADAVPLDMAETVAALGTCTRRSASFHADALRDVASADPVVKARAEADLATIRWKDVEDICDIERHATLFVGGNGYEACPADRLHVLGSGVVGDRTWGALEQGMLAPGLGAQDDRQATFMHRMQQPRPRRIDGVQVVGAGRETAVKLSAGNAVTAEDKLGLTRWQTLMMGTDDAVVGPPKVRQLLNALHGAVGVVLRFTYGRAVAGRGDACRLAQWMARVATVFQLVSNELRSLGRKALPLTYPKLHIALQLALDMHWYGSLEAVDTDHGETMHTRINRVLRTVHRGKQGVLYKLAERVCLVQAMSCAPYCPPPGYTPSPETWYNLLHSRSLVAGDCAGAAADPGAEVPLNLVGTAMRPIVTRFRSADEPLTFPQSFVAGASALAWLRERRVGPSGRLYRVQLKPDDVVDGQEAGHRPPLTLCTGVRLRYPSGNTNWLPLPGPADVMCIIHWDGKRFMERTLVDVAVALAPLRDDARSYLPDETLLLCRHLKLGPSEVQGWARVNHVPEAEAGPWVLVTGGVVAGPAVVHEAPWIVKGTPGEASYRFHWALQGPVGKQRSASEDA